MADRIIDAPHGSIGVTVSMKGALGGNELLRDATEKATALAAADGKEIVSAYYGTARKGDEITITFALKG